MSRKEETRFGNKPSLTLEQRQTRRKQRRSPWDLYHNPRKAGYERLY